MSIGLLVLRLVVGLTLAAHGAQKLFGWFGGLGLEKTGVGMERLGFVPGRRSALLAGLTEAGGGILLAVGLATPAAAALVLAVMLVAGVSAHLKQGFFLPSGYEYTLVLGLSALSLAFIGPGPLSLDGLLGASWVGTPWGLAALLTGLAAGGVQLARRQAGKPSAPAPLKT
jgi:putative oxidoreductase